MNDLIPDWHLIEAVQQAAQQYGIDRLVLEMDIAPSTLRNRLNPRADRSLCKLGLEEAFFIMQQTGDVTALDYMATKLGYRLEKMEEVEPDRDTIEQECCDDLDALAKFSRMARSKEFPPYKPSDVIWAANQAKKEIDQTMRLWMDQQGGH